LNFIIGILILSMEKLCIIENNVSVLLSWETGKFPLKSVSISFDDSSFIENSSDQHEGIELFDMVRSFLKGETGKLPVDLLDLSSLSPFSAEVLLKLRNSVPSGKTVSYSQLAKLSGHPRAARAVGTVLRNNPFPLFFPCHRVIRRNGDTGFFQGNREGGKLKNIFLIWNLESLTELAKLLARAVFRSWQALRSRSGGWRVNRTLH
jgi:O-6-methylguanine DNA methyltransferase